MADGCGAELGALIPWRVRPGSARRQRNPMMEVLLCFRRKEEEEARVGRVVRKAEQDGGAAGPTGPETEEKFFSE
jgi:hypothetical protein